MIASVVGQIGRPFYQAFAWLLAGAFAVVPNYAIAIAILTIVVMVVVFPLTLRATRGMMKMQLLAPQLKKLQAKYKANPSMSAGERQELRQRQNEELLALYRENGVRPTGGCVPIFLQFPIFIVLYGTIHGLIHQRRIKGSLVANPLYISHGTSLFRAIESARGRLTSFGVNLSESLRSAGIGWNSRLLIAALIVVAICLQYAQMRQLNKRNPPPAGANPQMQRLQRFLPLVFAAIYVSIPAGVNVYFIVSSLFRIAQQALMFRRDPQLRASMEKLRDPGAGG